MKKAFPALFLNLTWMALGAALLLSLPALVELFASPGVPLMWWAGRAVGMLAYTALWLSTLFGVFVGSRGAGGLLDRSMMIDLHSRWALMALAATVFHMLIILVDPHSGVSPLSAFVPMISEKLKGPVTLGTFAIWGMLSIGASTYFMDRLSKTVWRAIHAMAFGTFSLALFHGILAGSETQLPVIKAFYAGTTAVLLGAVIQRIMLSLDESNSTKSGELS